MAPTVSVYCLYQYVTVLIFFFFKNIKKKKKTSCPGILFTERTARGGTRLRCINLPWLVLCCSAHCSSVAATCGCMVLGGMVSLASGDTGVLEVPLAAEDASPLVIPLEADLPARGPNRACPLSATLSLSLGATAWYLTWSAVDHATGQSTGGGASVAQGKPGATWRRRYSSSNSSTELRVNRQANSPIISVYAKYCSTLKLMSTFMSVLRILVFATNHMVGNTLSNVSAARTSTVALLNLKRSANSPRNSLATVQFAQAASTAGQQPDCPQSSFAFYFIHVFLTGQGGPQRR